MLANVVGAQAALEEASIIKLGPRELVIFDIAVAFPSVEWR